MSQRWDIQDEHDLGELVVILAVAPHGLPDIHDDGGKRRSRQHSWDTRYSPWSEYVERSAIRDWVYAQWKKHRKIPKVKP